MSNTRYIEINSTYRDRNQWPLPGEFEILLSQSGRKNTALTAVDPVCNSTPIFSWSGQDFNTTGHTGTLTGTINLAAVPAVPTLGDFQTFVVDIPAGQTVQQMENYYSRAVIRDTTTNQYRRITYSKYIGVSGGVQKMQITVDSSFPSLTNGDGFSIIDPTDVTLNTTGPNTNPQIFLPNGPYADNAYYGYYLYNETVGAYRPIFDYNPVTGLITLTTSQSAVETPYSGPVTSWSASDNFSIRKEVPTVFTMTAATLNTVTLAGGSTVTNAYTGSFIRIISDAANTNKYDYGTLTAPFTQIRRVIAYDGTTQVATVSPAFSAVPNIATMRVELLAFSYDNLCPLSYSGSMTSQTEQVCYEIEMIDLVLPNVALDAGTGGRIAFYPFVYVEFANVSSPGSGLVNTIYSNNPNAVKMTFRSAINDISNPLTSSFIKLDSDGMVQTLKFKPNDNLKFSVRLPNGEIYETMLYENYSPYPPNPLVQISARFSIKRLN